MNARAVSAVRGFVVGFWVMIVIASIINVAHADTIDWAEPRLPVCGQGEVAKYAASGYPPVATIEQALRQHPFPEPPSDWQDDFYCSNGPNQAQCSVAQKHRNGQVYGLSWAVAKVCAPAPVEQCTAHPAGKVFWGNSTNGDSQTSVCIDNCSSNLRSNGVVLTAGGGWSGYYESTGQVCGQQTQSLVIDVELGQSKCQSVQGKQVCMGGGIPNNCIDVDGSRSCYSDAGGVCTTPECTAAAAALKAPDNSVTAVAGTTASPVPHTTANGEAAGEGNPTVPREPDASYGVTRTGAGTQTINYYAPTTVAVSCAGPCQPGQKPSDGPGDGEGGTGSGQFKPPSKAYNFGDESQAITAAKQRMATEFATIRTEAESLFGGVQGGSGGLPVFTIETRWGVKTVDLSRWESKVAPIGALLIFISMVSAAFIIFGGRD